MEELMYYVWQQRLFQAIVTIDDNPIEIIHPGLRNLDAGPDFFNAKIRIDGMLWAGNVEMHVKASDWFRHNHHTNHAYDNVILHVVLNADSVISLPDGQPIKTVVMKIPQDVMERYRMITANQPYSFSAIRCAQFVPSLPSLVMNDWLTALATQRMLGKVKRVRDLIVDSHESWQEAFYVILCRSLGTGVNGDACERLARSLPYRFLQKHLDNDLQVRALLLGQAGLIPADDDRLAAEYAFLRAKFSLTPIDASVWRLSRLRPQASPLVRLSALAQLLRSHPNLFSEVITADDIDSMRRLFFVSRHIGMQTVNSIIINAVVPLLMAYAEWQCDSAMCERALEMLEHIPAESNRYMDYWVQAGVPIRNAFDSQALLHLYREYCEQHKCMNCRIGCWLIKHRQ
ncbi:MAG: DUF2851 family protein [Bacteroidales bacterium]|nr:DUF2851 family protein [Candidatus Liminaster caballi]